VRPIQLLTGKVLGIGLVAFVQASAIVVFALVLAKSVGSDLLHGTAPWCSRALWCGWCWLRLLLLVYAAAGSLAERQEQVQSLAFPLSLPIIFGYIMALTAAGSAKPVILLQGSLRICLRRPRSPCRSSSVSERSLGGSFLRRR